MHWHHINFRFFLKIAKSVLWISTVVSDSIPESHKCLIATAELPGDWAYSNPAAFHNRFYQGNLRGKSAKREMRIKTLQSCELQDFSRSRLNNSRTIS